jgi:predicted permease
MDTLLQNLRYAFRQMFRNPTFSVVSIVTLALGIGATTVVFSLTNALLLRPLPVQDPGTLVGFEEIEDGRSPRSSLSYPHIQDYRSGTVAVMRLGAVGTRGLAIRTDGEATVALGGFVTGDFFEILGLEPALGRFLTPEEERPGVPEPVAVIGFDLWQQAFGGDPGVVGEALRANGQVLTIVGVAPRGFHGVSTGLETDVWMPIPTYSLLVPGSDIDDPTRHNWLLPVGRLNPGVGAEVAEALTSEVGRGIQPRWQDRPIERVQLARLHGISTELRTPVRLFMALLFGTAALVLLIACVNVAGMLLARATVRRREVGIRQALGAGRRRLLAQLLTESTLLFVLGGAAGLLLAFWVSDLLVAFLPSLPFPVSLDLSPDGTVVAFALAASLVTGLVFGLAPAVRASRADVVSSLKAGGGGAAAGRSRLRSAFVVGQISLSLLLLVTAGLLARSLQGALAIDTGMDVAGVVVAGFDLGPHGYDAETGTLFLERLTERLESHPDVGSVGFAQLVPLGFDEIVTNVEIPGHEPPQGRTGFRTDYNAVDGGYFETIGMPIVQGRTFTRADGPDAPGVLIVNETMARRYWPEGDALGATVRIGGTDREIVGIARDARYYSLREDPRPFLYVPHAQSYQGSTTLHVRSAGEPGAVAALMMRELQALDPNVPLLAPASLENRITMALLPQRMGAALIGVFGALGLVLAAVGLYGILAYSVSQRTREIGVRLALGAHAGNVLRLVVRQGVGLLVLGLAVGLVLAFAATRLLAGFLLDVSPTDPVTFLTVCLILGATALLASYLPARRAARVDPMVALRAE